MMYFLVTTFLILNISYSVAQYSLSPRIGDVIDRNEQQYFGLFPTITGFVSGKGSLLSDSQVVFVITRADTNGVTTDTTVTMNMTLVDELTSSIENFESAQEISEGKRATIVTRTGEKHKGTLLYASDSSLVLWQRKYNYNWRLVHLFGGAIWYSDIDHITIASEGSIGPWFGFGALIGALPGISSIIPLANVKGGHSLPSGSFISGFLIVVGAVSGALIGGIIGAASNIDTELEIGGRIELYSAITPQLRENSMFPSLPPPEVVSLILGSDNAIIQSLRADSLQNRPAPQKKVYKAKVKNAIYGELSGPEEGYRVTLNYEHSLFKYFWLRLGFGFGFGGKTVDMYNESLSSVFGPMIMPVFLFGGDFKLDVGLGLSVMYGKQEFFGSEQWIPRVAWAAGLRYQPLEGGLLIRAGFTRVYAAISPIQISLGYAF